MLRCWYVVCLFCVHVSLLCSILLCFVRSGLVWSGLLLSLCSFQCLLFFACSSWLALVCLLSFVSPSLFARMCLAVILIVSGFFTLACGPLLLSLCFLHSLTGHAFRTPTFLLLFAARFSGSSYRGCRFPRHGLLLRGEEGVRGAHPRLGRHHQPG